MNNAREITCILCPNGCHLSVAHQADEVLEVQHALCSKGIEYAKSEIGNPMRNLTATVKVANGVLPLVSVRSDRPLPKAKLMEAVKVLRNISLDAPVVYGQVIVEDILGTGVNIISTRDIQAV